MGLPRRWRSTRQWQGRIILELPCLHAWCFLVLAAVAVTCVRHLLVTAATASECSRLAPYFLAADQRIVLCAESDTSAPADCARKAQAASGGLSALLVVRLCKGATSEAPGVCVAGLSRKATKVLPAELRVELCTDAHSDAPARCLEQAIGSKRQVRVLVDVCTGASSTAPADCLELLPRATTDDMVAQLCARAQSAGPALCASSRGLVGQYGLDLAGKLCQDARGQGPAECFHRTALVTKLSTDDRVKLCIGAPTDAPARCAGDIRDHRMSAFERVALCHGSSSTAPARCVDQVPPTVEGADRVTLCQGAAEAHATAPALCLKRILQHVPAAIGAALCRGAHNSSAAECANIARHSIKDHDALVILCREASSTIPADCAKATIRAGADQHLAAGLCTGASSVAPALCFSTAPKQISSNFRLQTCAGAKSVAPALCMQAAMPRGIQAKSNKDGECPLDPEAGGPPRRGLEHKVASVLCKNATDDSPVECGRAAPLRMSDDDVEILCSAAGMPAGQATAQCATKASLAGISLSDAASICRGAVSDAPAVCAAAVAHRMASATRIDVCVGAATDAPARCVNSLSVTKTPTIDEIADCRKATPKPSGLKITRLTHDGNALFPDQPLEATLEVKDQWGGGMLAEDSAVVRASIALRGSNGAAVNAHGRFNTTNRGIVHFSHLSFSAAGSLTLQFSIDGDDGIIVPLASARVIVAETEHRAILRRCSRIFLSLSCPLQPVRGTEAVEPMAARDEHRVVTEAVSIVSGGAAAVWDVLSCRNVLEENGVKVAISVGSSSGSFVAWLWYHPGMEVLETGMGLPTRQQSAWERLGVERSASLRQVRRAYYRQSLLWHPDRWVRHSIHAARAQEVFEIVSEAYTWIISRTKIRKEEEESEE